MPRFDCPYCDQSGDNRTLEIDHIIPLSRGGCNCDENLVEAHGGCNRSKLTKTPLEYYMWLDLQVDALNYERMTNKEKDAYMLNMAKLEMDARHHMLKAHGTKPEFWDE